MNTKMIKLFHDFSVPHSHIHDSPVFSYLLHHNLDHVDPTLFANDSLTMEDVYSVANIVQIRSIEQLSDSQSAGEKLSACVVVVKPNQPINVACKREISY